jgi:hypothetical protein
MVPRGGTIATVIFSRNIWNEALKVRGLVGRPLQAPLNRAEQRSTDPRKSPASSGRFKSGARSHLYRTEFRLTRC